MVQPEHQPNSDVEDTDMQTPGTRAMVRTLAVTSLLLGLAACGSNDSSGAGMPGMDHGTMATSTVAPATGATAAPTTGTGSMPGMDDMTTMPMTDTGSMPGMDHGTMPMTDTGSMPGMDHGAMAALNEVQFIDGMIVHHQGAITMASTALTQTKRPEVKQLAEAIVKAQDPEIKQLQTWRSQWYPTEAATDPGLLAGMGMGDMDIGLDPTKEFDQRFLEAMISHHQGAIAMAKALQATHPELQAFADKVITDQTAEIEQMQQWLKEWYGK